VEPGARVKWARARYAWGRGAVQWYVSSTTPVLVLLTRGNFGWNLRRCAFRRCSGERERIVPRSLRAFPGQWELALLQDAALAGDRGGIPGA